VSFIVCAEACTHQALDELEALLKDQAKDEGSSAGNMPTPSSSQDSPHNSHALTDARVEQFNSDVSGFIVTLPSTSQNSKDRPNPFLPTSPPSAQITAYSPNDGNRQLMWGDWPSRLPSPDLLHHLIDLFFTCHPHAHYLLHRPTFMASLTYPPKSPAFPHVSLLHSICAYSSVFSPRVETPPINMKGGIFPDGKRKTEDSFAERHVRWSRQARDEATSVGANLVECTQCKCL
jgi:hypothetical protein